MKSENTPDRVNLFSIKCLGLLAVLAAGGLATASAVPITYTSTYYPTTLPQDTTATMANPSWYFYTGDSVNNVAAVSGGLLFGNTMNAVGYSRIQFWQVGQDISDSGREYGSPYDAWQANSVTGSTVDFTVRVTASAYDSDPNNPGGFQIFVGDEAANMSVFITPTGIYGSGAGAYSVTGRDNTVFQTYRMVSQYTPDNGNRVWLYEAGVAAPIFSYMAPSGSTGLNFINFGTYTSQTSGAWELGFIGWNDGIAEYSAPDFIAPIPEPTTTTLAMTGVLMVLFGVRRMKSKKAIAEIA
ncbi:hypothetical protein BH09VER1_BH09VER1_19140 [soil metagenome]